MSSKSLFAPLADGFRIAYKEWGHGGPKKVLALHGWMDNCNTFSHLGPFLADNGYHVVAIDQSSHGHSSHYPKNCMTSFPKYVLHARYMADHLGWDKMIVLGHSMGAAVSSLFAGTFPEFVNKLVLIEMLGPVTFPEADAPALMRKAFDAEMKFLAKPSSLPKIYNSLQDAAAARVATVSSYPGSQSLSMEAALHLVRRGCMAVDCGAEQEYDDPSDEDRVRFRHDPRLLLPSYTYTTQNQAVAFLDAITAPTLLVTGENGWPIRSPNDFVARKQALEQKGILTHITTPGSHHLHLDPDTAPTVAGITLSFLDT